MKPNRKSNIVIRIPENLKHNLLICLDLHEPNFEFKYHIDCFLYIIHTIRNMGTYKKFKNLQKVPIYSKILRFEIGRHYRKYLDYLLRYKFINTDNHYIVGDGIKKGKCKCYSIGKKYRDNKSEEHEMTKKSILSKILNWKEEKFGKMVNDELLGHLYEMIQKIDIDMDGVKKYLDDKLKAKEISKYKAMLELEKCKRINNKSDPYAIFIVKDAYGRVHTNFTNISKEIREKFLYLEGERVIALDIISSQPALLCALFREYFTNIVKEYNNYKNDPFHMTRMDINIPVDIRDKYVNVRNNYTGPHIYINEFNPLISNFGYPSSLDMLEEAAKEINEYENVVKGGLYEFFQTHWEEMFEDITRKGIKKEWISYVFGRKNSPHHEKMDVIWEREFPLLRKVIHHFKNGSHKLLAHELQRKESTLIFSDLCPCINDMGINYFTVHDSIVVKESDVDDTCDAFESVLEENNIMTGVSYVF